MNKYSTETEEIKKSNDIKQIASYLGIKITNNKAICPFHNDNDPSLSFYTTGTGEQRFKCFGCNAQGDVINLVMLSRGLEFKEALSYLKGNIEIGNNIIPKVEIKPDIEKDKRQDILDYFYSLLTPVTNNTYLESRGITQDTIKHFGIRYLNDVEGVDRKLRAKYTKDELQATLYSDKDYLLFTRHKIITPIKTTGGDIAYLQGRTQLKDTKLSKYIYTKGKRVCLYNEEVLQDTKTIWIVEGVFCVWTLHQLGIKAIAIGGVNGLNLHFKRLLPLLVDKTILVGMDSDKEGLEANKEINKLLSDEGVKYSVVSPKPYKDWNDYYLNKKL